MIPLALLACSGDSSAPATTSPSPEPSTAPASPSPSPPLADPKFSSENALGIDRVLSVDIGSRPTGSDAEKRAAGYIQGQLSSYGYRTELQPFNFDSFADLGTSLTVTSPESRTIEASALGASSSGLAEGSLLSAALGRTQEIPAGARGSILLVQRGDITFTEKVGNAEAAGAIGVIVYNNKAGVVNGQLTRPGNIPVAGITQADGEALLALAQAGPVNVRLEAKTETRVATSQNVVATPSDGACSIIAGGHYDSVPAGPGANDNASGTAVVVEMARTRAANDKLDDVCYVLFGAEEIGLVGSGAYVKSLSQAQLSDLKAMLNFDMLAVGNDWPLVGAPQITDLARREADALGIPVNITAALPQNVGSDHANFVSAGVPSIIFNCFCDNHYHSADDTFQYVRPERLAQAGEIGLGIINDLLGS